MTLNKNIYSEVLLIRPPSRPTKHGLNRELVILARPFVIEKGCFEPKTGDFNNGIVLQYVVNESCNLACIMLTVSG